MVSEHAETDRDTRNKNVMSCMIMAVTLTKISSSAIIIPILRKGARSVKNSDIVWANIIRLAPYALTR